ncbi:MAG TPA: DinB family protein, partial [Acidimicrobiales bacterium]
MIDEFAKEYLHDELRWVREALVSKLDGLSEYDVRRPLTATGTNLLGLIKHLSVVEARYFSEVFNRQFREPLPRWDDATAWGSDMWATADEERDEIIDRYRRAWEYADETIDTLPLDAPGYVPWWPRSDVKLFNVMVHILTETSRHAGHADILREQLDGSVGTGSQATILHGHDEGYWEGQRARIERAASAWQATTP